jgi:alpha-tubulin suppressor-like RCC1 family protein
MVAFAWTQEGLVFAWGMDPSEDGLMGLSGIFSSTEPVKIQGLARIAQVAVGKTHAAAIDGKI